MKKKTKILLVILCFLLLAVGVSFICRREIEKKLYPLGYSEFVTKYSREYDVPEDLVFAVIKVESDFDPDAESGAGAKGLMQLMPDTYDWLSRLIGEESEPDRICEPEQNIKYGTYYLRNLYDRFHNWNTAVAAYNAGHGRVKNWLADTRYSDDGETLKEIPITETKNYVNKVKDARQIYNDLYFRNGD